MLGYHLGRGAYATHSLSPYFLAYDVTLQKQGLWNETSRLERLINPILPNRAVKRYQDRYHGTHRPRRPAWDVTDSQVEQYHHLTSVNVPW